MYSAYFTSMGVKAMRTVYPSLSLNIQLSCSIEEYSNQAKAALGTPKSKRSSLWTLEKARSWTPWRQSRRHIFEYVDRKNTYLCLL